MGGLTDFFFGAKPPDAPAVIGEAASAVKGNAEELQGYLSTLRFNLDKYLAEYPQYAEQLQSSFDRQIANLSERYGGDKEISDIAYKARNDAIRDVAEAGSQERQNEEAIESRQAYEQNLREQREAQEVGFRQNELYGRKSLNSGISEAIGRTLVDKEARRSERRRGEDLRIGNIAALEGYSNAHNQNIASQIGIGEQKNATNRSLYEVPSTLYQNYAGNIDTANSGWDSAVRAGNAQYQTQLDKWQHGENRRNQMWGQIGNGVSFASGFGSSSAPGGSFGYSSGKNWGSKLGSFAGNFIGGPVGGYLGGKLGGKLGGMAGQANTDSNHSGEPGFR